MKGRGPYTREFTVEAVRLLRQGRRPSIIVSSKFAPSPTFFFAPASPKQGRSYFQRLIS